MDNVLDVDARVEDVKEYYGQTLQSTSDLKTSACCTTEAIPLKHRQILSLIDDDVLQKFYGCGSPIPPVLEGMRALDLGCGSGRDVFLLSKLVGAKGHVIGVDMTENQLAVARQALAKQMEVFGFTEPNVSFLQGQMEDLGVLGVADESLDLVVSNCVLNLSADKAKVFAEIHRVLKRGGEFYFSDVFADRRLPLEAQRDKVAVGECLGGALYVEDFRRLMLKSGFGDVRVVSRSPIAVRDEDVVRVVGCTKFESITYRAFKCPDLIEDRCEDYGQVATYLGGIEGFEVAFDLDDHHHFEKGRPMLVCGNTASMVQATRYAPFFRVEGDRATHFGLFECGEGGASKAPKPSISAGPCC